MNSSYLVAAPMTAIVDQRSFYRARRQCADRPIRPHFHSIAFYARADRNATTSHPHPSSTFR